MRETEGIVCWCVCVRVCVFTCVGVFEGERQSVGVGGILYTRVIVCFCVWASVYVRMIKRDKMCLPINHYVDRQSIASTV